MKNSIKKITAIIFVLLLTLSLPICVNAVSDEYVHKEIVECSKKTTIRDTPYQSGKAVISIEEGTMIQETASVRNRYGNIWLRTNLGYIYSGATRTHTHAFSAIDGCESAEFCSGGAIREIEISMVLDRCMLLHSLFIPPKSVPCWVQSVPLPLPEPL